MYVRPKSGKSASTISSWSLLCKNSGSPDKSITDTF